jgi:hypothetical protein
MQSTRNLNPIMSGFEFEKCMLDILSKSRNL